MPRPTTAQVAYGFPTVVLSTLAMLLLSGASSGAGVVLIAAAGLLLGLLVATAVTVRSRRTTAPARVSLSPASSVPSVSSVQVPRARVVSGAAEARVGEHSLRR